MSDYRRWIGAAPVAAPMQAQEVRQARTPVAAPEDPGFTSIWDRIWTDDFSKVPVLGPVASGVASGVTKFYDEWNGTLAWGVSYLPGGIDTISWDNRDEVSTGQAVLANAAALERQGPLGKAANFITGGSIQANALRLADPTNEALREDFNIEDAAQRDAAFDDGVGRFLSGTNDIVAQFFLDPLVIVGKGLKVARFGGKILGGPEVSGLTNRSLASMRTVQKVADEADTAMTLQSGKGDNVIGILADQVVKGDFEDLRSLPQFNNANRDILASIGAQITDRNEAITFLAAAAGSRRHIAQFRQQHASGYDAMRIAARGGTDSELLQLTKPAGEFDQGLYSKLPERDVDGMAIITDAANRDPELASALGWIGEGERLLDNIGPADNAFGRAMARRGANRRTSKWDSKPGTSAPVEERIFNTEGGKRPIRVWEWTRDRAGAVGEFLTGERGSGYMDVRGPNIGKASDDLRATLTDSKTIRGDKAFISEMINLYGTRALYAKDRVAVVKEIEERAALRLAQRHGVDVASARKIYAQLDQKRMEAVETISRGYGVDEAGELITAGPVLRSQLETKLPMLDMRLLEESFVMAGRQAADGVVDFRSLGWEVTEAGRNFLDQVNSLWKAAVLLRLGYTQRNIVEGWLRSAAALGTVPALKHPIQSSVNFGVNMSRRVQRRSLKASRLRAQQLSQEAENLRAAGDLDGAELLDAQVQELAARIETLSSRRRMGGEEFTFEITGADGSVATKTFSAFGGPSGNVRRGLASAEGTTSLTLQSQAGRNAQARKVSRAYTKLSPRSKNYFDELAASVRQFQADTLASMYMRGMSRDELVAWLRSDAATFYRRDMQIPAGAYESHIRRITSMVDRYLPDAELRASLAQAVDISPDVLRARLGGRADLSPIHGREVQTAIKPPARAVGDLLQGGINKAFDVLGNIPETNLVRHPFYAEVWKRKFSELTRQAREQGIELNAATLERINQNANRTALRAVNETLYTIERYSNVAHLLRYIAPFYPAFENSIKVWARLIGRDLSILGRANVLWNIPNQLGLVVDNEGNKVEPGNFDFLTGSKDRFIVLPDGMQEAFKKASGGLPFKIPQGSLNVVTPGDTPYLPGGGPLVTMTAAQVLAARPDWQDTLRRNIGEDIYRQIAPFGEVQPGLVENFAPAAARQLKAWVSGEEDELFVQTVASMTQAAYVDWYKSGMDPAEKPDYNDIVQQAQDFHRFRLLAALTLPFSLTRMSPYQVEMDAWNRLKADPNMTFEQKVNSFVSTYGAEFLPLTTSTSKYEARIEPTLDSYRILSGHSDLAREIIGELGPEAIGVLAAAAPPGEFDLGVYNWLGQTKVPGTNDTYRSRRGGMEMEQAITMQTAWREYNQMKELRDAELSARGLKSLSSAGADDIKAKWDYFSREYMTQKYGDSWVANGPQSYQERTPVWLTAINKAMNDQKFMAEFGDTPLWSGVRQYMQMRNMAVEAIAVLGADPAAVREQFAAWSNEFRYSSLQFSDFWDRYLENDELYFGVGGE